MRTTLMRTGMIALAGGAGLALWQHRLAFWPIAALLVFWFSFGGHWVEILFLNWLRPRISSRRSVQVAARIGTWYIGGTALAQGMLLTAKSFAGFESARWPAWWLGGLVFIGVELVVHLVLLLGGWRNFYDGRG